MPNLIYKKLNLNYSIQGEGFPIVLLHGFLEDLGMWNTLAKSFEKHHQVICLDLLGHGKTENLGYIHKMETQAEMLKFLLDDLEIKECIIVGHSMGGYIALAFAELYPENLKGICLMNSTAMADSDEKKRNRDRGITVVKNNHKTFIRMAIPNLFTEKNQVIFKDVIKDITKQALQMSQQGIIASLEGMKIRPDRTHILGEATIPILMIIGQKDPALDYNKLLLQVENNSVSSVIFKDGHMSHIENEQELISALSRWFIEIQKEYID